MKSTRIANNPYLEKTLEVNQVSKLFHSINQFTKAFDIVDSLEEDGTASVTSSIESMPGKIDDYRKSKFEHDNFIGYIENGSVLKINSMIGSSKDIIEKYLSDISSKIQSTGKFYLSPEIKFEDFKIIGDFNLSTRKNRRGPFRILVKNDIIPGNFLIEISSYLFKVSTSVQKALNENIANESITYSVIGIDDYHALSISYSMDGLAADILAKDLLKIVLKADEWEEKITKGQDSVVFE